jgi:WD40 repeat protein
MTSSMEAILESHTHRVNSVAFAEDSNRVLCLWTDGTARIWDVPNGTTAPWQRPPPVVMLPWIMGVNSDCWIPPRDRDFVASAFSSSTNRVCLGYPSGRVVILDMEA